MQRRHFNQLLSAAALGGLGGLPATASARPAATRGIR